MGTAFLLSGILVVGVFGSILGISGSLTAAVAGSAGGPSLGPTLDTAVEGAFSESGSSPESIVRRDAVTHDVETKAVSRPEPDVDGDLLNDDWERRGRTPDGTALPDANPGRMDLYVQVNHGTNVPPLSAAERRQLRQVWASMPLENPDGSTGIAIHLDADAPRGGSLGEPVDVTDPRDGTLRQYYTADRLGNRTCTYRHVVMGVVRPANLAGRATAPGYASMVDGRLTRREGEVSLRVAVITHELLHNVAGEVDAGYHTQSGWLSHGDDQFLSSTTTRALAERGFAPSPFFQRRVCWATRAGRRDSPPAVASRRPARSRRWWRVSARVPTGSRA
ncbi:hypothetical protein ACFQJD_11930 [Haloplanus sp. GCM10025708]|uniref:hypothetical protein n=1 Tax=Haloplanus sp. GCM10025708 TaxID=3252679 RepID=UPI003611AA1C